MPGHNFPRPRRTGHPSAGGGTRAARPLHPRFQIPAAAAAPPPAPKAAPQPPRAEKAPKEKDPITLAQFLKVVQVADTGGQAKTLVREGRASVNGTVDERPGRKLEKGDIIAIDGKTFTVDR